MATNVNVGSAYLTIIPSTNNFIKTLRRELNKAGFDKIGKGVGKAIEKGFQRSRVVTRIRRSFVDMFDGISQLGRAGMLDTLIASALALLSALAPLSGLVLGIPAAAVAAGLAIGALALAVEGLGTALGAALSGDVDEFNSALADMTDSARSVTREIGGALMGLKDIAQESLFAPMVGAADGFAETMRGPVQRSIRTVATALGEAGASVLTWLKSSEGAATLERAADAAATTIREMSAGLVPLLQGTLDLASALDIQVGQAIANVATRFGEWMSEIAADGRAQEWFDAAIEAAGKLWRVLVNLGRTLVALFNATSADGGTLSVLIEATDAMADWAESAQGQETLNEIFQFFGTVLREVGSALGTLISAFAVLAGWFNDLSPETQSAIAQFMAWSIVLGPFAGRLVALVSLVRGLWGAVVLLGGGLKAVALASVGFIRGLWGGAAALTAKSGAAMKAGAAIRGFIGAMVTATIQATRMMITNLIVGARMAASAALNAAKIAFAWGVTVVRSLAAAALAAARNMGLIIAAFARTAVQAAIHAGRVVVAWAVTAAQGIAGAAVSVARSAAAMAVSFGRIAAAAALSAGRTVAAWALMALQGTISAAKQIGAMILAGAKWVWLGVVALVNAARVALAWFIAMGPIGWIIAILIALVAVFILFWDEIKAALVAAGEWMWGYIEPYWNRLVEFLSMIWEWIKDVLNWDELVALISDFGTRAKEIWDGFWNLIKETVSAIWDLIVGLVTGNTEKVQNAISRLKELPGKFAEWFSGAYNSVKEWLGNALDYVKEIPGRILDALGDLGSLLVNAGKDIIDGLISGVQSMVSSLQDTFSGITDMIPDWKGPASVDKKLLVENAHFIMGGFDNTVKSWVPKIRDTFAEITDSIGLTTSANINATLPADPSMYGTNIENVNVNASDNRFSLSQLEEQVRMRV